MLEVMDVLVGVTCASTGNIKATMWVAGNSDIAELARDKRCSNFVMLIDDILYACSVC